MRLLSLAVCHMLVMHALRQPHLARHCEASTLRDALTGASPAVSTAGLAGPALEIGLFVGLSFRPGSPLGGFWPACSTVGRTPEAGPADPVGHPWQYIAAKPKRPAVSHRLPAFSCWRLALCVLAAGGLCRIAAARKDSHLWVRVKTEMRPDPGEWRRATCYRSQG